jgi:GxxExxY protein
MAGSSSDLQKLKGRFHKLDFEVMKHAFEIHNRMGNYHDEEGYQNELLHLIQRNGIHARKEAPLTIASRSFKKTYYLDLLIEGEHIYELKVLQNLTNQCRSQTFNYQLIYQKPYGKLVNFGSPSVEHEFCTSTLTKAERQNFTIENSAWDDSVDQGLSFISLANDLFSDWGTRLDPYLYSEAILALLPEGKEARIEVVSEDRTVGNKLVRLAKPRIAFKLTTAKHPDPLEIQLQKFINHTNLFALHWINLNQNQITFRTLRKK